MYFLQTSGHHGSRRSFNSYFLLMLTFHFSASRSQSCQELAKNYLEVISSLGIQPREDGPSCQLPLFRRGCLLSQFIDSPSVDLKTGELEFRDQKMPRNWKSLVKILPSQKMGDVLCGLKNLFVRLRREHGQVCVQWVDSFFLNFYTGALPFTLRHSPFSLLLLSHPHFPKP